MADDGASSSSNSLDDLEDRQECSPPTYTSSFTSHATNDNCTAVTSSGHMAGGNPGIVGISRLSYNPFAIKTTAPTRSVADSTDSKEARPLVAPPTLKLGSSEVIPAAIPKIVLRPSALSAQAEKLKFMNNTKQEGKENSSDESNNVCKEAHSTMYESNGKISKAELFASGFSSSSEGSAALSSPTKSAAMAENTFSLASRNSGDKSPNGSFIFGQNLHERALNYDKCSGQPLSPTDSHNLTFEETALKKEELEKMEQKNQEEKQKKSLSESAKEYESKQVKRKFDEVTVVTGEEDESNVLQINCKLFAFDKVNMNWLERGRGFLRLNDREFMGHIHSRVVMRIQGSLRVVLNTQVWAGMSVEHPSQKTVRLTAFDPQGVKVFLVMAHPKDAEQLFSALDWRVTDLRSREESLSKDDDKLTVEEATSSSGLPDTSCNTSPSKRSRVMESGGFGADSSTESSNIVLCSTPSEMSSDSFVDSTDTQCHELCSGLGDDDASGIM